MRVAVHSVRCPNWNCSGFVILTREELDFIQLKSWDVHLNLICPFCTAHRGTSDRCRRTRGTRKFLPLHRSSPTDDDFRMSDHSCLDDNGLMLRRLEAVRTGVSWIPSAAKANFFGGA